VIHDEDGRIQGFQEKPDPAEALSDLGNCGIYCFSPEIFDYFPQEPFADWAQDVFPELLAHDVPFFVHEIEDYWNDVGSLDELRAGTFDALEGRLRLDASGVEVAEGVRVGSGSSIERCEQVEGPVWVGADCSIGAGARLIGPLVIGDSVEVRDGAALRDSIVLPGTRVEAGAILIGAIAGHGDIVAGMRRGAAA
jgi:mannose-1-phosphate guanylyltransferase/mannose-1-phosphate guanylyltransferase/phosphomannomutase